MPMLGLGLLVPQVVFGGGEGGAAPAPVSFSDTFDRASVNPMSDPVSGGTWTSGPGGFNHCQIVDANLLQGTSSYSGARVLTPAFASDHKASITVAATASFFGPCVRMQSASSASCYTAAVNAGTTLYIYKITESGSDLAGGDFAQLGSSVAVALAVGNTLALEAIGSTLNVYINDILVATRSDASFTGGQPGVLLLSSAVVASFNSTGDSGGGALLSLGDMVVGSSFTVA